MQNFSATRMAAYDLQTVQCADGRFQAAHMAAYVRECLNNTVLFQAAPVAAYVPLHGLWQHGFFSAAHLAAYFYNFGTLSIILFPTARLAADRTISAIIHDRYFQPRTWRHTRAVRLMTRHTAPIVAAPAQLHFQPHLAAYRFGEEMLKEAIFSAALMAA
ncbi:MAG: hypothetical protein M0Z50_11600 [Planctomycetia bacterium]|nr:hypothetical protein [Planctomycetia bacterium]